jgi:hypothetical protein
MMMQMIGSFAEFERATIRERLADRRCRPAVGLYLFVDQKPHDTAMVSIRRRIRFTGF